MSYSTDATKQHVNTRETRNTNAVIAPSGFRRIRTGSRNAGQAER